jgi:hypothetical protein
MGTRCMLDKYGYTLSNTRPHHGHPHTRIHLPTCVRTWKCVIFIAFPRASVLRRACIASLVFIPGCSASDGRCPECLFPMFFCNGSNVGVSLMMGWRGGGRGFCVLEIALVCAAPDHCSEFNFGAHRANVWNRRNFDNFLGVSQMLSGISARPTHFLWAAMLVYCR